MDVKEYERADVEVIKLVNENYRNQKNAGNRKPERGSQMMNVSRQEDVCAEPQGRTGVRLRAAACGGTGILILGAMVRGWIVPGLGIMAALSCFAWAVIAAWRGKGGARSA